MKTLTAIVVALAASAACACASAPLSSQAAALPVFAMEQAHPAVTKAMGPMKTYACLGQADETQIIDGALNTLRNRAAAKGADALVDYRYTVMTVNRRVPDCHRYVEAEAVAVMLATSSRG